VLRNWSQALLLAERRSVELWTTVRELERTAALGRVALATALPTLNISADVSEAALRTVVQPLDGEVDQQWFAKRSLTYGTTINLNVPVIDVRSWYGIRTANAVSDSAELNSLEQKRLLVAALANAILGVVSTERLAEITRITLATALDRARLTAQRVQLGVGTQLDVVRLDQDVKLVRHDVVTRNETLRQAQEALGLALGYTERVGISPELSLSALLAHMDNICRAQNSVAQRPDVRRARTDVRAQNHRLGEQRAAFWPTLSLSSSYRAAAQPFVNGLVDRTYLNQTWSIAGLLNWAIFDGGARYGRIAEAEARLEQVRWQHEGLRRTAKIQVRQAMRGVGVAEQAQRIAKTIRDTAFEAQRLSKLNFELGRGTTLDLIFDAQKWREAEVRLALRQAELVQSKIRARVALSVCQF